MKIDLGIHRNTIQNSEKSTNPATTTNFTILKIKAENLLDFIHCNVYVIDEDTFK